MDFENEKSITDESALESNKRDHKVEITDIAISKVPLVKYREIPEEHYETLQEIAKAVLELSREYNDCNETAITYSLDDPEGRIDDDGSLAVSYGGEHDVDPVSNTKAFVSVQQAEQIREASRLTPLKIDASPGGFTFLGSRSAVNASRC